LGENRPRYKRDTKEITTMNILIAIVAIVAVILLFTGGFVQSLNFLLWVGIVLLIIAAIVWLIRFLTGRRTV
jgi:preprotein translocase subunit SecF